MRVSVRVRVGVRVSVRVSVRVRVGARVRVQGPGVRVPSLVSAPASPSSRKLKLADLDSKPPVLAFLNMVQMIARSCRVAAVRRSEPSTLLSCSLTSIGPVSVRRGPRFHTTTSFPEASCPGSWMLMSCARK